SVHGVAGQSCSGYVGQHSGDEGVTESCHSAAVGPVRLDGRSQAYGRSNVFGAGPAPVLLAAPVHEWLGRRAPAEPEDTDTLGRAQLVARQAHRLHTELRDIEV